MNTGFDLLSSILLFDQRKDFDKECELDDECQMGFVLEMVFDEEKVRNLYSWMSIMDYQHENDMNKRIVFDMFVFL